MTPVGHISQLSLAALRIAASDSSRDAEAVAQWLYRFGTVPRGPAIDRDFGPDDDPMAILGITAGARVRRLIESAYDASALAGWYSFSRTGRELQLSAACKLYVSPRPAALANAFSRIADVFVRADVRSFKVGRGIEGLLRPDKIIAYFDDRAHMVDVARALERSLRGCPVQGVPFTTELGGEGLLSAGIDPPLGTGPVSWRSWVTKRLAAGLVAPRGDRVKNALRAVRRAGVDPITWQASADAFRDEVSL